MSFPGHFNAFLPTQIHPKSSSRRRHDTCREKPESSELLLHDDNLPTLETLGFCLWNPVNMNGCRTLKLGSGFWILLIQVVDQRVRIFSLSLLFWQFQKKEES